MQISVLIAAYRAGPYLRTALASVARQTHRDWELVVVEDGSHDETEAVVRGFAATRPTQSIRYENNGRNRGVAATRNRLMALARGDVVAFLDADDWWEPGHLAAGARQFAAGAEFVVAGVSTFDLSTGRELGEVLPPASLVTDAVTTLFDASVIITSSAVMLSRGLIARTGEFDLDFAVGEDRDYWLRAALAEARCSIMPGVTCHYAKHAASTMSRTQLVAAQTVQFYEKHSRLAVIPLQHRRQLLAHHLINQGRLLRQDHAKDSVRQLWRAWRLKPANFRAAAHLVFTGIKAALRASTPAPRAMPPASTRPGFFPPAGAAKDLPLSICIPAYNAERYLPETLASVRAQTFTHWELIVIEDGTHDGTEELVAQFARQGSQPVIFHRQAQNQGLPATRNAGIALARGDWVVLLDNDDLWTPDHLASLVTCANENPAARLIHSGSVLFDSDSGRELEVRAPTPEVTSTYPLSLFLGAYCIQPSSVMLRKSLWTRVGGFDVSFRYAEDREMWMRCAQAGAIFAYTGRNTCLYRKHATSLSTNAPLMAVACALILDKAAHWENIPRQLRQRHAAEAWVSAGRLVLRSDPKTARAHFARARRYRPTPRVLAYGVAALGLHVMQRLRSAPARGPLGSTLVWLALALLALAPTARALDIFNLDPAIHHRFLHGSYTDGQLQENPGFLLAGHDLSGLGWGPGDIGVTLISPRHFVTSAHVAPLAGTTVSFFNRDGVIKHYVVESIHPILHSVGVRTDLVVGRLTLAIPPGDHIGSFPTLRLPANTDYPGLKVYSFGIYQSCGTNTIARWGNYDVLPFGGGDGVPDDIMFATDWHRVTGEAQAQGNDSGSPTFVLYRGQLALVGTHSAVNVTQEPRVTVDVLVPAYFTQIKALLARDGFDFVNVAAQPGSARR